MIYVKATTLLFGIWRSATDGTNFPLVCCKLDNLMKGNTVPSFQRIL